MAANLSKKFALLCCCLMTMQALRLVISTAGFCVVRFHIDCSLFNIFISRLVNAVLMSQLFGNWIGDLIVFAADGTLKLIGLMLANWVEFGCFCSALICICHTECGHLTGFYWSMVCAYFWWKVGEAPTVSIAAPDATDYFFAGFTLSGVWASCLKGLVMWFVAGTGTKPLHFHSVPLGDVNVKIVGARSVKTTVDYRAAKWLYIVTIVLTALMCLPWSVVAVVLSNGQWRETDDKAKQVVAQALRNKLKKQAKKKKERVQGDVSNDNNRVAKAIRESGVSELQSATVDPNGGGIAANAQVTIGVAGGSQPSDVGAAKGKLTGKLIGETDMMMAGVSNVEQTKITLDVKTAGVLGVRENQSVAVFAGIAFGGVLAVPGAMLGAGVGWVLALCLCCISNENYVKATKWCQLIFGIVGAAGGMAACALPCCLQAWGQLGETTDKDNMRIWVEAMKWDWPVTETDPAKKKKRWLEQFAPMMGLGVGMATGAVVGAIVGLIRGMNTSLRDATTLMIEGAPMAAGAFFGSFFGIISGEIYNGKMTANFAKDWNIVGCGFFIVVSGLGTVYSIYPGMAPCSITQFQYFNIIDICILVLSSFAPFIIMGLDLADVADKLGLSIVEGDAETLAQNAKWWWCGLGLVLTICTLICEIIVLHIMHHPFSKMTQKVTTKPTLACFITITMVTFQLVSTGIGFGCVAAGSTFNDGVNNVLSTLVLWTTECCGVLGEGYQTELKKYEPGKWPTQGMGKWSTYWWWNGKAFVNAWAIWCCIGTTDLRRDIMLCRQ